MKIGELAQAARCTTPTVRFYEHAGLLPTASRTHSNYRSYSAAHVARLRFIRNCRALDMTHGEIRTLLTFIDAPRAGCGAISILLDEHIGHVDARIEELQNLKTQLTTLRAQCQTEQAAADCGILHSLAAMEWKAALPRQTHLS